MLNLSARGIALIAKYEGFSPRIYICPAGYKTIGYGHVVLPHEVFDEISENAARKLLRADAAVAQRAVRRLIHVPLTQNQFDALVSLFFRFFHCLSNKKGREESLPFLFSSYA